MGHHEDTFACSRKGKYAVEPKLMKSRTKLGVGLHEIIQRYTHLSVYMLGICFTQCVSLGQCQSFQFTEMPLSQRVCEDRI